MGERDFATLDVVCEFVGDNGDLSVSLSLEEDGGPFGYGLRLDRCQIIALRGLLKAALEANDEMSFSMHVVELSNHGSRSEAK